MTKRTGTKRTGIYGALALASLLLITSCASTTLTVVWKDDNYRGRLDKVLVIGVSEKPVVRRVFEDEFAMQLQARGVGAVPSHTLFATPELLDKGSILSEVERLKIDGIIVTRLVERKVVETYVPGETYVVPQGGRHIETYVPGQTYVTPRNVVPQYVVSRVDHNNWHGYYQQGYATVHTEGYTVTDEIVVLETNLYDAKTEKLIWSALSETFVATSLESLISEFIGVIVKDLSEKGLLK